LTREENIIKGEREEAEIVREEVVKERKETPPKKRVKN